MASFYSPSAEWRLLVALTEESEDRVCGRFGSSYAHGQQERLDSAELETMRMSRNPTTVMTANSEKKRQCMSIRKTLLVKVISWNSRSSFFGDTLWKIMGIHITGRAVKNHISSEMASELIAIYRTYVPFVVRGSSAISSSPALSLLLSSSSTPLITLCPKEKGEDGQRRGANQRRSDGFCQRIGLFRECDASWRNDRSSFVRKALRGVKRTHSHVTFSRVCMHS